jgi:hypothetical protein
MTEHERGSAEPGYTVQRVHAPEEDAPATLAEEPLEAKLAALAALIVSDLERDGDLEIRLAQRPSGQSALRVVMVTIGDSKYGFGVDSESSPAELILSLAEGIVEHLPESSAAWGKPRPQCPRHPHPLEPRMDAGLAYWACPQDETNVATIGEYRR